MGLSGTQIIHVPLSHRVFGNSWDSDEDMPTRPQPQGHMPNTADSNGYYSHNEDSTDGETEAQRGKTTCPGQPAGPLSLVGRALGLWGSISRRERDVSPLPGLDTPGEPAVSHKGLDCYLDSLFDPVLSCGDAVGMAGHALTQSYTFMGTQPRP